MKRRTFIKFIGAFGLGPLVGKLGSLSPSAGSTKIEWIGVGCSGEVTLDHGSSEDEMERLAQLACGGTTYGRWVVDRDQAIRTFYPARQDDGKIRVTMS
ncbi:MAG: hypothetical protein OEU36_02535 [Gammaproteobacteria bacterium]|nr:hypothetical protein [Gammaproteobacteria bacterium]